MLHAGLTSTELLSAQIKNLFRQLSSVRKNEEEFKQQLNAFLSSQGPDPETRAELRKKLIQASLSETELFPLIWATLQNEVDLDDWLIRSQEEPNKGTSALWWLAFDVSHGDPEAFLKVWQKFEDEIMLADLLHKEDSCKGKSILWWLAAADDNRIFLKVWEKFKNEIKLSDLLLISQDDSDKGISAFWWLAFNADNDKPEAFFKIWTRFRSEIKLEDLHATAQTGLYKGKSILSMLSPKYSFLLDSFLRQVPAIADTLAPPPPILAAFDNQEPGAPAKRKEAPLVAKEEESVQLAKDLRPNSSLKNSN